MDWKLEVVVVPVTDVDRAKAFYVDQLGFHLDADTWPTESMRVVQMTPPGSSCSVTVGPVIGRLDKKTGFDDRRNRSRHRDLLVQPWRCAALALYIRDRIFLLCKGRRGCE